MSDGDPRDRGKIVRLPGPKLEQFRPFYASQMEGWAPVERQFIVDGLMMPKTVALFSGPPKIGKSLLLQQILTACALGESWLGRKCQRMRAFGLFAEDPEEELVRRQIDINRYYDRSPADYELDLSWDAREGKDATLINFGRDEQPEFTALWHQLWAFVQDCGFQVIGLDTAAAVFGGNENFRNQVTYFMRALVQQAVLINGLVILTAHPNKMTPNGYSGTTAWLGSSRFGMSLQRPPEWDAEAETPRDVRSLRPLGANYGTPMRSERVRYDRGIWELDDVPASAAGGKRKAAPLTSIERQDLEYRLLQGLRYVLQNGAEVPADESSPKSMPARARRSPEPMLNRISIADLSAAQRALIETGRVVRVEVAKKCLIRPAEGPAYRDEKPWVETAKSRPVV